MKRFANFGAFQILSASNHFSLLAFFYLFEILSIFSLAYFLSSVYIYSIYINDWEEYVFLQNTAKQIRVEQPNLQCIFIIKIPSNSSLLIIRKFVFFFFVCFPNPAERFGVKLPVLIYIVHPSLT